MNTDRQMETFLINNELESVVTELFIRVRKLNISLVFTIQSYFSVKKNILNFTLLHNDNSR